MDYSQEVQDSITYVAMVITNVFYIIIVGILHVYDELPLLGFGALFFGIGVGFSLVSMIIITLKAIRVDADRSKTIIKLAIFHVPALIGLTILFVSGFVVM